MRHTLNWYSERHRLRYINELSIHIFQILRGIRGIYSKLYFSFSFAHSVKWKAGCVIESYIHHTFAHNFILFEKCDLLTLTERRRRRKINFNAFGLTFFHIYWHKIAGSHSMYGVSDIIWFWWKTMDFEFICFNCYELKSNLWIFALFFVPADFFFLFFLRTFEKKNNFFNAFFLFVWWIFPCQRKLLFRLPSVTHLPWHPLTRRRKGQIFGHSILFTPTQLWMISNESTYKLLEIRLRFDSCYSIKCVQVTNTVAFGCSLKILQIQVDAVSTKDRTKNLMKKKKKKQFSLNLFIQIWIVSTLSIHSTRRCWIIYFCYINNRRIAMRCWAKLLLLLRNLVFLDNYKVIPRVIRTNIRTSYVVR